MKPVEREGTTILTIAPNNDLEDTKSEEGELSAPFSYSIQEYNTQTQTEQIKADSAEVLIPLQLKASKRSVDVMSKCVFNKDIAHPIRNRIDFYQNARVCIMPNYSGLKITKVKVFITNATWNLICRKIS